MVGMQELASIVEALGGESRHALRRHYVDGHDLGEICAAFGLDQETFRGLQKEMRAFWAKPTRKPDPSF